MLWFHRSRCDPQFCSLLYQLISFISHLTFRVDQLSLNQKSNSHVLLLQSSCRYIFHVKSHEIPLKIGGQLGPFPWGWHLILAEAIQAEGNVATLH